MQEGTQQVTLCLKCGAIFTKRTKQVKYDLGWKCSEGIGGDGSSDSQFNPLRERHLAIIERNKRERAVELQAWALMIAGVILAVGYLFLELNSMIGVLAALLFIAALWRIWTA